MLREAATIFNLHLRHLLEPKPQPQPQPQPQSLFLHLNPVVTSPLFVTLKLKLVKLMKALLIFAPFAKRHLKDKKPEKEPIVAIDCAQVIVSGKRTKLQISALNAENG